MAGENTLDYVRCQNDGCLELEPHTRIGGNFGTSSEERVFSTYTADRRDGGCGATFAVTADSHVEHDHARGIDPKHKEHRTEVGRKMSVPSAAFQDNYDRIFRKS